jgi:coenzyme F420-0:L-glutamate ligase / coenzyme F420-1:gamma-L-glutamate ligase
MSAGGPIEPPRAGLRIEIAGVEGIPEITEGDGVGALVAEAAAEAGIALPDDAVVVISQKVVSKAEGRIRHLAGVEPAERAGELAADLGKDPRLVELVLAESKRVVRAERGVLIVETHSGWICANAGIDASNVPGDDTVALLPVDPDASARRLRAEIGEVSGTRPAVVVADSFGRPWRLGQTDVAIGCAGLVAVEDRRGDTDAHGRVLTATAIAVADQLAAAADLSRDRAARLPAAVVRGCTAWVTQEDGPGAAATLQRPSAEDLFR